MNTYPKVILLDGNPDASTLGSKLRRLAEVTWVDTIRQALALVEGGDGDVLFCPWEPSDGTWRCVLKEVRDRQIEMPVIVYHHSGSEQEWAEVLAAGGFDLLAPPYDDAYGLGVLLEHAMASRHGMKKSAVSLRGLRTEELL